MRHNTCPILMDHKLVFAVIYNTENNNNNKYLKKLTCSKTFSVNISCSLAISTTFPSICLGKRERERIHKKYKKELCIHINNRSVQHKVVIGKVLVRSKILGDGGDKARCTTGTCISPVTPPHTAVQHILQESLVPQERELVDASLHIWKVVWTCSCRPCAHLYHLSLSHTVNWGGIVQWLERQTCD